jgi:hypothetical protein
VDGRIFHCPVFGLCVGAKTATLFHLYLVYNVLFFGCFLNFLLTGL